MSRRGITLIEVLISMFVVLVGVLSAFCADDPRSVRDARGFQGRPGNGVGRRRKQDMLTRGMLKPLSYDVTSLYAAAPATPTQQIVPNWIQPPAPTSPNAYTYPWGPPGVHPPAAWPLGTQPAMPFDTGSTAAAYVFALDPLGVAANTMNPGASYYFPASSRFQRALRRSRHRPQRHRCTASRCDTDRAAISVRHSP